MPVNFALSVDGELLVATGSNTALGSLTAIGQAKDVTVSLDKNVKSITTKNSGGWVAQAPTTRQGTVSATIVYIAGNTEIELLRDSYLNNTTITACVLSGPAATSGSEGPRFDSVVKSFSMNQPVDGVIEVECELTITQFREWEEVA